MVVFHCSACNSAITTDVTETSLPPMPVREAWVGRERDKVTRRARPTMRRGRFALDPEPFGPPYVVQEDEDNPVLSNPVGIGISDDRGLLMSAGPRNTVVLHPADGRGLSSRPDGKHLAGCCGMSGIDGPNLACRCGAVVATLSQDCSGGNELRLEPALIFRSE
jgi:hypothetical protein